MWTDIHNFGEQVNLILNADIRPLTGSCLFLQVWHQVNRNRIWQCNTQQNSESRNKYLLILRGIFVCILQMYLSSHTIWTMLCLHLGGWDYFTHYLQTNLPNHWWGLTFTVVLFSFFHILFICMLSVRFHAACVCMLLVTKLNMSILLCYTLSLCHKASTHYWLGVSTTLPSLCMMWV